MYMRVTYQGKRRAYDFMLAQDTTGELLAVCNLPNGGITTCAHTLDVLMDEMIPDAVETWEEK
jgi:hypothetical protein